MNSDTKVYFIYFNFASVKQAIVISILLLSVVLGFTFGTAPQKITKARLGEMLFFDPILSEDSSISCATCHKPEFAFADNVALSEGVFHRTGNRNTPSAMNQKDRNFYFWDGRSETLKEQA